MSIDGTVTSFDQSREEWRSYTERLKHYFVVNQVVDDDKKYSILLSAYGPTTYSFAQKFSWC